MMTECSILDELSLLNVKRKNSKAQGAAILLADNQYDASLSLSQLLHLISILLLWLQVMQNNHIASVTLYGAPRPSSLARVDPSIH